MNLSYDPLQLADDPYPVYRNLRAEAPVYHGQTAEGVTFWALSRYDDVEAAALDWETYSSAEGNDLDDTGLLFGPAPAMDCADPPRHTRMRGALRKEFSPAVIRARLGPVIQRKVQAAVDRLAGQEVVDFADELAYPLPAGLICDWLGFPEDDHDQLRRWHSVMLERSPGMMELPERATAARDEMWEFLDRELADRRARPRDDLLSVMARAQLAGELTQDEALANVLFLFDAGIVSTNAIIASALFHLRDAPDQWRLLRRNPDVAPSAVEEFLRFDAPFHWFKRVTTREVELHGTRIPAGERVILIWASANRDERRWENADRLVLDRPVQRHLSFNIGIHHCLGAGVARMELQALFRALAERMVEYEITGPVERRVTPSERTIVSMPAKVRWAR
ncbi:cytochrome P450 [Streptomyces sp. NBC_01298]|uniref:cytochrome P450 n=1 Tax=Streptomyces sp. NBC_01298 TaxID=2903817 RepID=UPI002E0F0BAA|nr:cytochrome P450 [Streptomyces sp. NBC_01298]